MASGFFCTSSNPLKTGLYQEYHLECIHSAVVSCNFVKHIEKLKV